MSEEVSMPTWSVLLRGLGPKGSVSGHGVEGGNKFTASTYSRDVGAYADRLIEGGWVVDKSGVPAVVGRRQTLSGPMFDVTLAAGEVDRCPQPSSIMLDGLEGVFGELAQRRADDEQWSGLDTVAVDVYAAGWAKVGARVGRKRGEIVVWEDENGVG